MMNSHNHDQSGNIIYNKKLNSINIHDCDDSSKTYIKTPIHILSNKMEGKITKSRSLNNLINYLDSTKISSNVKINYQISSKYDAFKVKSYVDRDFNNLNKYLIDSSKLEKDLIVDQSNEKVNIDVEINGLEDLLILIKNNPIFENVDYNINMKTLHKIYPSLKLLHDMIGMETLKNSIVDQVIYYIQEFNKYQNSDFMHTVIYGSPGTGKTEIAKIIGQIFSNLGILKKGTFRKVTRSDLIAGYLGQTALKTRDVIKDSLGGVLFIDEAYSLGNNDKRDYFAKECIDTICEALSDHKDNIMVIIAGYEEELKTCFFNYNQGLESRFPWRFKTDNYEFNELFQIFIKKIKDCNWKINNNINNIWFKEKMDYFKYYGRDMETLLAKIKICHSRRVFCKDQSEKTKISKEDMDNGFKLYLNNDEVKSRGHKVINSMYL